MNSVTILKKPISLDVLICCVGCLYIYEIIKLRIVKKTYLGDLQSNSVNIHFVFLKYICKEFYYECGNSF